MMKKSIPLLLAVVMAAAQEAPIPQAPAPLETHLQGIGEVVMVLPLDMHRKEVPVFYSVTADVEAHVFFDRIETKTTLEFQVHQGKVEMLGVALSGDGEVTSAVGEGMKDWSIRVDEKWQRFFEMRPNEDAAVRKNWTITLHSVFKNDQKAGSARLLLPGKGAASGFSLKVKLINEGNARARVVETAGLWPVEESKGTEFVGFDGASLQLDLTHNDAGLALEDARLQGGLAADGKSVSFVLTATVQSSRADADEVLLDGAAAISSATAGDGWHVELRPTKEGGFLYHLVAERKGAILLEIHFEVPVTEQGDWRKIDFTIPAGVVVPLWMNGLIATAQFEKQMPVVPAKDGDQWRGFLPADGHASLAWRDGRDVADGALFFSSSEISDVRIGSGLLRQGSVIDFRIMQGKLGSIVLALAGPGEILSVQGEHVVGWSVKEDEGKRTLQLQLNRPMEGSGRITVESQAPLTNFPFKSAVLRISPRDSIRHSGWLRVANDGAVKIEVTEVKGLIQLAPEQFPVSSPKLRQSFVYRFPSADYSYQVLADHVLPETSVNELTIYELAETDRRIIADLELDIREAPLREWEIDVPAEYTVVSVTGAAVDDYSVAGEVIKERKRLKIMFREAVQNRQLISLRLEKNEAVKAGSWGLTPLLYPTAKSHRGFIGVVTAAGYRIVPGPLANLAEVPLSFFPKQVPGLQQTYRIREGEWSAKMTVEALGQSIQADVFHLYSVKEGAVYGSILFNYFVVGAPATEWRVQVPKEVGNIEITGQNVGHEWSRAENVLIIPLSRPLLGAGTMLLTFEQPIKAAGGEIAAGEIRPLNVQSERGYVQVVSPLQVNPEVPVIKGQVLPLQTNELPAEYRMLSSAPTLGAWQYTAAEFAIGLKFSWFKTGETVEQVVDFVKLSSQVSRDGQLVTEARFFVKSKRHDALRMRLPADAILWETKVNGETANPRKDNGEVVIPLPQKNDLNTPVEISLRYGLQAKSAGRVKLIAPVLLAPTVIGEWTVTGDEGRQLLHLGGTVELVKDVKQANGFEWLSQHSRIAWIFAAVLLASVFVFWKGRFTWLAMLALLAVSSLMAWQSIVAPLSGPTALAYAAPVVKAGAEMVVELQNSSNFFARMGFAVWLGLIAGLASCVLGLYKKDRSWLGGGVMILCIGLLCVRGAASAFFLFIALCMVVLLLVKLIRSWPKTKTPLPPIPPAVTTLLLFAALFTLIGTPLMAEEAKQQSSWKKTADRMDFDCRIVEGRLLGTVEVSVRAVAGDRFPFLQSPAVLGEFNGEGLRVLREKEDDGRLVYLLQADQAGVFTAKARFEMPLANPQQGWILPGAVASMRSLKIRWDEGGWELFSPAAAQTTTLAGLTENESGASMVLRPAAIVEMKVRARQRDASAEKSVFFVEASHLMMPLPGVVNGRHAFQIRPSQGRVTELTMIVPQGFTVSDVGEGPTGEWRFDPVKSELHVAIEPAQVGAFSFTVQTQRGTSALPVDMDLQPLRVVGAAGEVGTLALAFGDDAQPEKAEAKGLSLVNPDDFNKKMLPRDKDGKAQAVVQQVYRYGGGEAALKLRVAPVAPEMRAESWQVLSLGDDRILLAADFAVTISRAGMFRLLMEIPEGMEIESASGDSLGHWTESTVDGKRLMTLHLRGRTLGLQNFHITLTGAATGAKPKWSTPRIVLREATRESGIMTIVPDAGMRVNVVERNHVSAMDPRELGDAPQEHASAALKPGALAFRLLQTDWKLELQIDELEPWVTAQVLHDVVVREGQISTKINLIYRIENAAMKTMRVRIPGLTEMSGATVRATGPTVADFVKVADEKDLWELRFQHSVSGNTQVDIEFQQQLKDEAIDSIHPVNLENARQVTYFVAVRAGGRMELLTNEALPEGWLRSDWAVVQSALPKLRNTPVPTLSYKVADGKNPLTLKFQRHQLADVQKMRVTEGSLTTLISSKGESLTAVNLQIQVAEKGTVRLRLPKASSLYNVLVNDEGASLVKEGDEWLFYVFPSPDSSKPATLRFVYAADANKLVLEGPSLNVPMENLTWRVLIPEGWRLSGHEGDFDLKESRLAGSFRLENYQEFVSNRKESSSKDAVVLLEQANAWINQGDQEKASIALGNASRNSQLDEASNEDARVQLRQLKTQQAVLGLNTRRQRLFLDNKADATGNQQLEQAANINPVLQGRYNYDPKQFDRFTEGNSADENAALKAIANRIVTQQLAVEPVPSGLEIAVPERGSVLTFARSIQVDGAKPMRIELDLQRKDADNRTLVYVICALLGVMIACGFRSWHIAKG